VISEFSFAASFEMPTTTVPPETGPLLGLSVLEAAGPPDSVLGTALAEGDALEHEPMTSVSITPIARVIRLSFTFAPQSFCLPTVVSQSALG
jgi:hypothetical protein